MRRAAIELAGFAAPPPVAERQADALAIDGRLLPVRIYSPPASLDAQLPGLIYFHGGGWVSGGLDTHDALCAALAVGGDCRIIAVDYRVAPEARFPAAQDDAFAAAMAVLAEPARWAIDSARIGIGGDSAGGHLAAFAASRVADAWGALALLFLLCPVLDPLARTPSRRDFAKGFLIEEATMERYWELYRIEGLSPDDPRVAPRLAPDFAGLPASVIHTAEYDPMRDEGALYAEALAKAGVPVRLTEHAGLIHNFYALSGAVPAGAAALARIGADLREALRGGVA
jgi:acetyl esterase/lipase